MLTEIQSRAMQKLPTEARRRLMRLMSESETLFAAARLKSERRNELRRAIEKEEIEVSRVRDNGSLSAEFVETARQNIADWRQQLVDLDVDNAEERRTTLASLVRAAFEYLNAVPAGHRCQEASRAPVKLRRNDTFYSAVQRCRETIAGLRGKRSEAETAPIPTAIAKQMAARQIEQLAERGRPSVDGLVAGTDRQAKLPETFPRIVGEASGYVDVPDAFALIAHLMKDKLIEVISAEIDAAGEDEIALSPEDREAAIEKINIQIAETEAEEADYLWQADRDGLTVPHRADIGIPALLSLSGAFTALPKKPQESYRTFDQIHPSAEIPQHSPLAPQPARRLNDDGSYAAHGN